MMKRWLCIILLLAIVGWWAASQHTPALPAAQENHAQAPYPADFRERLSRIPGIQLNLDAELPAHLPWQLAATQPGIGHPAAQKGGCVRFCSPGPFPAHFLRFGGGAPQFFHQNLLAATEIPLLWLHPHTGGLAAGVAEAWATAGKTVYFRLNPAARYNNGRPLRAADYLLAALLQAEQHCPGYTALVNQVEALSTHGEHTISLSFRSNPNPLLAAELLLPAEPGFYAAFDSRYREAYAQRIPPAAGPYRIAQVERGRLIRLERIPGWWGEDMPVFHRRFNADTVEYHFLTSEAQSWEFFKRGKLDMLQTRNLAFWQEKTAGNPDLPTLEYDAEYPLPPYGIALNTATLPELALRRGLLHAMDMDSAVQTIFRGEGQRLRTFHSGYSRLSPTGTPEYHYAPLLARRYFADAGFTTTGSDGILRHQETGIRLSVRLLYTPNEKISTMVNTLIQSAAACGAEILPEAVPWQNCHQQLQQRQHQMVFWAVPAPAKPEPAQFFGADAEPATAPFALDSSQMNKLLEEFRNNPTAASLASIDQLVYELGIWLPGWKENRVRILHHPRLAIPPSTWCYDAADAHLFWVQQQP